MIDKVKLINYGRIKNLEWDNLGRINLVIGENGSGKSFLLKALYCTIKTIEDYKRGKDIRSETEILSERLHWTFQAEKIGDIVRKAAAEPLYCEVTCDDKEFSYSFGKDTTRKVLSLTNRTEPRDSNSVFLPSKEVLSLFQIILKSRDEDKAFGFDDTYYELAKAIRNQPLNGASFNEYAKSKEQLKNVINGSISFCTESNSWQFVSNNRQKFDIGVTAEGIKKIAILDTLLANRYLDNDSIVFFDEPESALHPSAITQLLDIIALLSETGMQFFIASHSYFVIKKLALIAKTRNISIPVVSLSNNSDDIGYDDLREAMPKNSIIEESIRLYKEEIEKVM